MSQRILIPVFLGLSLGVGASAQADDGVQTAATTANVPQTLELGTVEVVGKQRVAQVLLTIKQALKAPDSTDAKHRDDLVCRFVHEMANPQTYLDCATNATNMARRSSTQMSRMAAVCTSQKCDSSGDMQSIAQTLVANQPGQRLHMLVKASEFRKLLDGVTQAPAVSSVAAAPAAASTATPANHR